MTIKVHGNAAPGESLTGDMEWYTIRTTMPMDSTGVITDDSQNRLNTLIDIISVGAQPVISGKVTVTTEDAPVADLPSTAGMTGTVDVYTFKFACEHKGVWDAENLAEAMNNIAGFISTTPTTGNNVSVIVNDML